MVFLKDLVGSRGKQRTLPEFGIFMAEEEFLNTTPAKSAPTPRISSGTNMTAGDSWT